MSAYYECLTLNIKITHAKLHTVEIFIIFFCEYISCIQQHNTYNITMVKFLNNEIPFLNSDDFIRT